MAAPSARRITVRSVEINRETVSRLNLAWTLDLDVTNNLSTPLAVDGVIYVASGYSFVHAVDVKTGKLLWRYDPEVAKAAGVKLRTGWGIRGLSFWKGRLFVGTHDGRLISLDAKTGKPVWSVQTIDTNDGSFVSGPPRVFNDKVIIGFGGGDFGAVRGYVTAYDTATGKQLWRWCTVPGDPAKGFENKAMEMAAKTWTGEWWKYGGGGTVWNAMTYDPEFNRVYLGTGNGGPWNWKIRSPSGGDNLFLCSVVALDADTGEYVWHYQTTPGDAWDYNSAMDMTLATLNIGGSPRKVLLHAPKNGFFYVIDRNDGKLISAEKLGTVTWATKVDLATGRPVLAPNARYENGPVTLWPSFQGVHNLYPQSFSPKTGLVYVPTIEMPATFGGDVDYKNWKPLPASIQFTGFPTADGDAPADAGKSFLVAWDPVKQRPAVATAHAGTAQRRHPRDGRRPGVPGAGGRLHQRLRRVRRSQGLVVLRRHGGARHADHLFNRQDPVRVDPHRPAERRAGRLRFHGGAFWLGCAHSSAPPADLRARWQGQTTSHATAHFRPAARWSRK